MKKKKRKIDMRKKGNMINVIFFYLVTNDTKIFSYKLINIIKHHLEIKYPLRNG